MGHLRLPVTITTSATTTTPPSATLSSPQPLLHLPPHHYCHATFTRTSGHCCRATSAPPPQWATPGR
eukprot:300696-Alexandrium_andersonii.AAC.1